MAVPLKPGLILDSPGEMVGTTHYDMQSNGSTGTRIVKDYLDGFHFSWTNGIDFWSGNRWVYYNFVDENGNWLGPTPVDSWWGPQMDVLSEGRAAIAYATYLAVDDGRGFGHFTKITRPDGGGPPYLAVDRTDRIHIISYLVFTGSIESDPAYLFYTRFEDGNWTDPELVDSLMCVSAVIVSSNVSDKVAIAYTYPRDFQDPDQYNNDVCCIESEDGTNWDWNSKVNITDYQTDDTIRAYTDLDAVYDWQDNLHIIWNTPYYDEIGGYLSSDACLLWHWSETTGITFIADGWWPSSPGAWNRSISKMSIGVWGLSDLFAIWTQFTDDDKSAGGWSNGELFRCLSIDGGATWFDSENLTNSPSPGCWPGECDSDHWSSLAEEVDGYLHIVYINDKDAGGVPHTEGVDTENPVMYYAFPLGDAVDEDNEAQPTRFAVLQNYPNPFNATTEITYQLEANATVKLEIFNLLGEKTETLINESQSAGQRSAVWDASDFSSGIYFYRLTAGDYSQVRRMTLLR